MNSPTPYPCRRCQRDLSSDAECEEALHIHFRAGYGSIFGDGSVVSSHLCQHCLRDLLGPYLIIQEDDPCCPKISVSTGQHAFQAYQLRPKRSDEPSREEILASFPQMKDE